MFELIRSHINAAKIFLLEGKRAEAVKMFEKAQAEAKRDDGVIDIVEREVLDNFVRFVDKYIKIRMKNKYLDKRHGRMEKRRLESCSQTLSDIKIAHSLKEKITDRHFSGALRCLDKDRDIVDVKMYKTVL